MKVIIVAGARPNFIKIAPLIHVLENYPKLESVLVNTGQHYDKNFVDVFFRQLEIPEPDYNLEVGSAPRTEQIALIKQRFAEVVNAEKPDLILVVGDVNSTIACAEIGKEREIKIAHVEAGLRSGDLNMPEEVNRIQTDKISDYLFVTEQSGIDNLLQEGIARNKIFFVGNVMIDTLIKNHDKIKEIQTYKRYDLEKGSYCVATFHRPSNVDSPESLKKIISVLNGLQKAQKVIIPLHHRTRTSLVKYNLLARIEAMQNLIIVEPLGYFEFLNLVMNSNVVVTDSGGIQEETTYLGMPCVTMRENTERPVTVKEGTNFLVGQDVTKVLNKVSEIIRGEIDLQKKTPKYWDGKTASRIWEVLT